VDQVVGVVGSYFSGDCDTLLQVFRETLVFVRIQFKLETGGVDSAKQLEN